jgi:hypothetical protein
LFLHLPVIIISGTFVELEPAAVLPLYDASPNFVSGHFLLRAPCDEDHVPFVTVIAGHIDDKSIW